MFQSEPICILQAGTTVDGRVIDQKIIDEIAESYSKDVYTARINEDHYSWSYKYGTVQSVEKRDDKLFAVLKPNSMLLRAVEQGQLLHTSCEYQEKFSDTDKAYLTGLALTDNPASLGTTQIHLSQQNEGKVYVQSNFTLKPEQFSQENHEDDASMFNKFKSWLKGDKPTEQLSQHEELEEMSKETEELLKQSVEQNKELNGNLSLLIQTLSAKDKKDESSEPTGDEVTGDGNSEVTELKGQVTELSSQLTELTEKFSKITDEDERKLAGQDGEDDVYL